MIKKYFGTDGIRGRVNDSKINGEMFFKFGLAAGTYFKNLKKNKQTAIIAKDTRLSGYTLEPALVSGLASAGMHIYTLGPLPTNGLAMLTKKMKANMGIMITASHNPYYDNGLKLFGPDGLKLSDKIEKKIEKLIDSKITKNLSKPIELGRVKRLEDANENYIKILKQNFPSSFSLKGIKIALDCANGAGYKAGPDLFKSLGAKVYKTGTSPNGLNINLKSGSTHPSKICQMTKKNKAHIGISLDGDADRIIVCDEKGKIIDGDKILAMLGERWKRKKILKGGVIGTLMSNYGLENFFNNNGIKFLRSDVGDRYVKEKMKKNKFNLGGEQSGHIILGKFATTGDGLLVALEILFSLRKKKKASELFNKFKPTPQMKNLVEVKNIKKNYGKNEAVKGISFKIKEDEILGLLGPNGSGKTTTIGMLLGLLKPTSGEILVNGQKLEGNRIEILEQINFISPYIELPKKLTVKQNLTVYGKLYKINNINERIEFLSEKLRLEGLLNSITGELSSGQKNRVSLAKALINEPKVLLLDEPTASLDPEVGDFVRSFLEDYKKEKKISILLASHNMNEVTRLCKSILMMKDGIIIDKGNPDELINKHGRKNLEEVFLKLSRSKNELN